MDTETLRNYIGALPQDDEFITQCLDAAELLINSYIGTANVPQDIRDRCYLETGSELYHRRQAPLGISQFATFDSAPIRIARDPLTGVYPILNRYVIGIG